MASRHLRRCLLVIPLLLLLGCSSPAARPRAVEAPSAAAVARVGAGAGETQALPGAALPGAAPLVADNAAAADPTLVPVTVSAPAGFRFRPGPVRLPPGFSISLLAEGLSEPRFMAFDPAGNLLVGSTDGSVYRLPAGGAGEAPALPALLLSGMRAPHSVAFWGGYLYVAETGRVSRYSYGADGSLGPRETVIGDLPVVGEHFTRTVVFGPDGAMYLGAGSSCNICDEQDERRAAISRYNPDGSGYERVAWGARNPVGLTLQPGTGALWATINERDYQGNEIPPDLVTVVHQGDNFGWPDCQPPNATPQNPGDDCSGITPPTVAIQAHSAPLGLAFYSGSQFPADYAGDLFVVEHGSWNREPPAPPQLVRIHFESGRPVSVRTFATGWQTDNSGTRWGRPAGVIVAPDGSLIVSDDDAGVLYRISYGG